jgi:GT2 family glycosyltransferase
MNKVAVVILNYNGRRFLETFLPSVVAHTPQAAIYVADNGSTDDSLAYVAAAFPTVVCLPLGQNYGFAKGYNLALRQITAEYFVLLNSDVEVTPHWLEPITSLMDADPQIAACQPKLLDYHKRTHFEYAGPVGGFIDYLGYPFCRGRIFQEIEADAGQYNDTIEVFWACGACVVVRAQPFWEVGGLDDDFFAHMEEIDVCWRLKNAGYKVFACGASVVYHVGGGTLNYATPNKTFLNFRNGLALLYKNHPTQDLYLNLFKRLLLDGVAGIKFLLFDSPAHTWAIIRAHFNFYANFGHWRRKRKVLLAQRRAITHAEVYPKSIVLQHFLFKKRHFDELHIQPKTKLEAVQSLQ